MIKIRKIGALFPEKIGGGQKRADRLIGGGGVIKRKDGPCHLLHPPPPKYTLLGIPHNTKLHFVLE